MVLNFLEFSENPFFLEDVVFHHKMLSLSNFGLDLGICFVNTVILINKYFINLCRFSFNKISKVHYYNDPKCFVKLTISHAICDV